MAIGSFVHRSDGSMTLSRRLIPASLEVLRGGFRSLESRLQAESKNGTGASGGNDPMIQSLDDSISRWLDDPIYPRRGPPDNLTKRKTDFCMSMFGEHADFFPPKSYFPKLATARSTVS